MLNVAAEMIEDDLRRYGEDEVADWIANCTDEELLRVCSVAEWLLYFGPGTRSGSIMIATACALGAVYIHEGAPRHLARKTRKARKNADGEWEQLSNGRRPNDALGARLEREHGSYYGVGEDARAFWDASSG